MDLVLNGEEWRQIDYLILITQPFFDFTTELSRTKDATTHHVYKIYNKLFGHLEQSISQLQQKKVTWKKNMLQALQAAQVKLRKYYSETDDIPGDLYAIGTMIAPANKIKFFSSNDWDEGWRQRYRKSFKEYLLPYQARLATEQTLPQSHMSTTTESRLDMMLSESNHSQITPRNELTDYLDSGMC